MQRWAGHEKLINKYYHKVFTVKQRTPFPRIITRTTGYIYPFNVKSYGLFNNNNCINNKVLSGHQQSQVFKWRKNQRLKNHLCFRPQGRGQRRGRDGSRNVGLSFIKPSYTSGRPRELYYIKLPWKLHIIHIIILFQRIFLI